MSLGRRPAASRGRRAARAMAGPLLVLPLAVAGITLALPSSSSAQVGARATSSPKSARASLGVTLKLSSPYQVTVPPGTWVPINVSVADRGAADVHGQIVVQAPAAQVGLSTPGCLSNGPSTFTCLGAEDYAANLASRPPAPTSAGAVTYTVPLELAAGTTKQVPLYVVTGAPGRGVSARVLGPSGRVLAQASASLPVAYGLAPPAVLVVTDSPQTVYALSKLVTPTGAQPQLQYTTPSGLPAMAAPLGAFRAVTIDQADMTGVSPAQIEALEGYVETGGTLVVAGGLDWQSTTAGLPPGLLPGRPTGGVSSMALPGVSRLLGTTPVPGRVDVDGLAVIRGGRPTLTEGKTVLVVEATRGSGHVVFSAMDPAAAPLATWPGARALLSRLFAPAYRPGYYDSPLPYAEAGGVFPVPPSSAPASVVAKLGGNFDTGSALMSPSAAVSVLAGYLGQAPSVTRPPSVSLLGLLLAGYVVVVALVLFGVIGRARRRVLAWAAVPAIAILGVVTAGLTGIGVGDGPLVQEIRISQLSPGGHLAQVTSLGMVQLPGGGSRRVELASLTPDVQAPALVGNLAVATGAAVTVGQGPALLTTSVTVSGRPRSRGGWSASEIVHLPGTVHADAAEYGGLVVGAIRNDVGVKLTNAEVVVASGEASEELGAIGTGRTARFELTVSPSSNPLAQAFGAPAPVVSDNPVSPSSGPGAGDRAPSKSATEPGPSGGKTGSTVTKAEAKRATAEIETALGDLAASYSTQQGGMPVFVATTAHDLFPSDASAGSSHPLVTDVLIVPLTAGEIPRQALFELPGELVGSTGVTGETQYAITTGSLTLEAGGTFDYEFLLPGGRWRRLDLDLGSSSGETYGPPLVLLKTYDYATGRWDELRVRAHSGELLAAVPDVARHLGPGGTLEVQVEATQNGVEVYGGFPTLSAIPAASRGARPPRTAPVASTPFRIEPARPAPASPAPASPTSASPTSARKVLTP
jgi:hypothetical protein